jgi:hypothetical protein
MERRRRALEDWRFVARTHSDERCGRGGGGGSSSSSSIASADAVRSWKRLLLGPDLE